MSASFQCCVHMCMLDAEAWWAPTISAPTSIKSNNSKSDVYLLVNATNCKHKYFHCDLPSLLNLIRGSFGTKFHFVKPIRTFFYQGTIKCVSESMSVCQNLLRVFCICFHSARSFQHPHSSSFWLVIHGTHRHHNSRNRVTNYSPQNFNFRWHRWHKF